MLNIPDSVKTLFKQDGVQKNFRVHFPDGELPDITNDNVVQESVRFTESLCSQDVLKFGLTEASVIEFETVGIGNMYGMTIECGIEIDLSSLTAAQLNDIASGTWDGVYTGLASSDIGYAYFRVPYGIFRIESCPRDHQAMSHRKVQAYGQMNASSIQNWFEIEKCNHLMAYDNVISGKEQTIPYVPKIKNLILSHLTWRTQDFLVDNGFTKSGVSLSTFYHPTTHNPYYYTRNISLRKIGGGTASGYIYVRGKFSARNASTAQGSYVWKTNMADTDSKLYSVELSETSSERLSNLVTWANAWLEQAGIDLAQNGFSSTEEFLQYYIGDLYKPGIQFSFKKNSETDASTLPNFYPNISGNATGRYIPFDNDNYAVYAFRPNTFATFYTPTSIEFYGNAYSLSEASIYEMVDTASGVFENLTVSYSPTLKAIAYGSGGSVQYYSSSFANSYSVKDLVNSYLELSAMFGRTNRSNYFSLVQLDNTSPFAVQPLEYSQLWWDEYEVLPIGSIKYSFTDSNNEEQVVVYTFGSGASIYDMTGNEILKVISNPSDTSINSLLDTSFIPHIGPIAFTPIELDMKGLPYMEAGDYLAVTLEDGTIASSFNMKMEISGIQVLTASIESTSGQIIESGES